MRERVAGKHFGGFLILPQTFVELARVILYPAEIMLVKRRLPVELDSALGVFEAFGKTSFGRQFYRIPDVRFGNVGIQSQGGLKISLAFFPREIPAVLRKGERRVSFA